jgi:enoyl-CoA hydratase/carnithine racemase
MMTDKCIRYEVTDGVAWLTLWRPETGNLVNAALAAEFTDACRAFDEDESARVLVVSGAGDAFCRGAEDDTSHPVAAVLAALTKPVFAMLNGDAIGQGLEIALAADVRIAAESANFALPQAAGGRLPGDGGSQRLPRLVGLAKGLELLLTGEQIDAAEARRIGLVSRVYPDAELLPEVSILAAAVSQRAPVSMRFTREAVYQGLEMTLEQGLRLEADLYALLQTTGDRTEGITAFLEKRPPKFEGQ